MTHISETISTLASGLRAKRDNEISIAHEVALQYVTDHNDKQAYRVIERQITQLAKSWDKMITLLEKTTTAAEKLEASCENFYGD